MYIIYVNRVVLARHRPDNMSILNKSLINPRPKRPDKNRENSLDSDGSLIIANGVRVRLKECINEGI